MNTTIRNFKGSVNSIKQYITSDELFAVDNKLMIKFGFWASENKYNLKLYLILLYLLIFDFFFKFNFLRKAFVNKEYRSITLYL